MSSIAKRRRDDGTTAWKARYRTPSGGERSKTFSRKVDAERFLASVETAKHSGAFVDPALSKVTVGQWAQTWLAGQMQLKPTTYDRYESIVRNHVDPTWSSVPLAKLSHSEVQAWVNALTKSQSASSVRKIHRVLSQIIDMAVRDGRLSQNVAQRINLPRPAKPEHRYLSYDDVERLAQAAGYPSKPSKHSTMDTRANETYRLVVLFLAYTGVRFGEMAALKLRRLDFDRGRAFIAESVTPLHGTGMVWGTPKTHQRRSVPIPDFLLEDLAKHVARHGPEDLVFGSIRSRQPIRATVFRTAFKAAATEIGIPDLHPHELRHTAASLAIAAGADVKVVQQMLGHASAAMTLDTYGHLLHDRLDEVASAMAAARKAAQRRRESDDTDPDR